MYGAFIHAVRLSRGMSQYELAEVARIDQPNLSAYERGRRVPTAETLNKILVACGYQLAATDGDRTIFCSLPLNGWFPDDDLPPGDASDPPEDLPLVTRDTPIDERARVILSLLDLADATR